MAEEIGKRKLIFAAIIGGAVIFILLILMLLSASNRRGSGDGGPASKDLVIWTVGMETGIFTKLESAFNESSKNFEIDIKAKNFGSFEDYVDILPRVIADGNSPDIFVVPNNGGYAFFEQYMTLLTDGIIDVEEFGRLFHPLFPEQLLVEENREVNGTQQLFRGAKGIPVGFETLGVFYNALQMQGAPKTWNQFPEILRSKYQAEGVPPLGAGKGEYVLNAADIVAMMLSQEGLNAYTDMGSIEGGGVISNYINYAKDENGINQYEKEFDAGLTNIDLFAQEKVASVVGYPSTMREIELAIKRSSQTNEDTNKRSNVGDRVRFANLPQIKENVEEPINLARYYYLSLSRTAKNPENAIAFLNFLVTPGAQKIFFQEHPYYLPATNDLLASEGNSVLSGKMIVSDFYSPDHKYNNFDMGIPHFFRYIVSHKLDEPRTSGRKVGSDSSGFIGCKIDQFVNKVGYDRACE